MGSLRTDTWEKLLEQMEEAGVGFYLNGRRATPKDIIDNAGFCHGRRGQAQGGTV